MLLAKVVAFDTRPGAGMAARCTRASTPEWRSSIPPRASTAYPTSGRRTTRGGGGATGEGGSLHEGVGAGMAVVDPAEGLDRLPEVGEVDDRGGDVRQRGRHPVEGDHVPAVREEVGDHRPPELAAAAGDRCPDHEASSSIDQREPAWCTQRPAAFRGWRAAVPAAPHRRGLPDDRYSCGGGALSGGGGTAGGGGRRR